MFQLRAFGVPGQAWPVQTAAKLILEPIFEADFPEVSYGFRPRRSAHEALDAIEEGLARGLTAVYDAQAGRALP